MTPPEVSVLMSVYNGERYIEQSIRSVLDQTLENFELLILDDASTDRTADIVLEFRDERISFRQSNVNKGLFFNLNRLIETASAPVVKLWSQDDLMTTDCLTTGARFFADHPEVGCFYCSCDYIGEDGELVGTLPYDTTPLLLSREVADRFSLLYGCLAGNIATMFFPRGIFADLGFFKEDWISADFDMMVRVQEKYSIGRVEEVLVHQRQHNKQWSRNADGYPAFFREDLRTYDTLRHRLVHVHGTMTDQQVAEIMRNKFARNYFHGAVRFLLKGDPHLAIELVRRLGPVESAAIGWRWLQDMPRRKAATRLSRRTPA